VQGARAPPHKIREKYFYDNYYVEFGHFSGKNHVKFLNFVNFSGKIIKFGYFDNFSGKNHVKFRHFVNFSYRFFEQKWLPPLKLTELLRLWSTCLDERSGGDERLNRLDLAGVETLFICNAMLV